MCQTNFKPFEHSGPTLMVAFLSCSPSKVAFRFFRWDVEILQHPRRSTCTSCCCWCCCYQPCFHTFEKYLWRWQNQHLVLTLAYSYFGERRQLINIHYNTINLKQLFPSLILHINYFWPRQKPPQATVKTFLWEIEVFSPRILLFQFLMQYFKKCIKYVYGNMASVWFNLQCMPLCRFIGSYTVSKFCW